MLPYSLPALAGSVVLNRVLPPVFDRSLRLIQQNPNGALAFARAVDGLNRVAYQPLVTKAVSEVRSLASLVSGRPYDFDATPLTSWEMAESAAMHAAFTALVAPLSISFLYRFSPEGVVLEPGDIITAAGRYVDLMTEDMKEAGVVFPRSILKMDGDDLSHLAAATENLAMFDEMIEVMTRPNPVLPVAADEGKSHYPRYFLTPFHAGRWESDHRARSWGAQTEALFFSIYAAMLRSTLSSTMGALELARQELTNNGDQRPLRMLEIGGAGGTLARYQLQTWDWRQSRRAPSQRRELQYHYVELGERNRRLARERLAPWGHQVVMYDDPQVRAENLKVIPDASMDAILVVNLFHELPRRYREECVREMARVLRSGGQVVFSDSVQTGDGVDSLIKAFHTLPEPFHADYSAQNMVALFEANGFRLLVPARHAYLGKKWIFRRP